MKILTTCLPNRQANQTNYTNNYTLGIGNRLASWGDSGEALYNTAGCLTNFVSNINNRELNLSWDSKYELKRVKLEGKNQEVNYGYNVLGQRISRIELINGVTNTEYYVHSGVNIVADLDEDKELLRSYSYTPGCDNIISMTSYGDSETNTYFYIRNHNNSVVALVDEDGDIAESYEYSAYGEVTVFDANGNELDESALGNRYTFQGREIDWTTGLYNFRARWYDPETGRWLSKDPIGIRGGLNQYVFCGNNPVMFGDPEGLNFWDWLFPKSDDERLNDAKKAADKIKNASDFWNSPHKKVSRLDDLIKKYNDLDAAVSYIQDTISAVEDGTIEQTLRFATETISILPLTSNAGEFMKENKSFNDMYKKAEEHDKEQQGKRDDKYPLKSLD